MVSSDGILSTVRPIGSSQLHRPYQASAVAAAEAKSGEQLVVLSAQTSTRQQAWVRCAGMDFETLRALLTSLPKGQRTQLKRAL